MSHKFPVRILDIKTMEVKMYEDIKKDVTRIGYVCISHVWGAQKLYTAKKLGIKSGVDWDIPLSDPDKLERIKRAVLYYKKRYCWLDLICIPQGEDEEKKKERIKEIPNMGSYYENAIMTLVIGTCIEFKTEIGRLEKIILTGIMGVMTRSPWDARTAYLMDKLRSEEEPWFNRVWTFQEAVFSKNMKYVGYGDEKHSDMSAILKKVPTIVDNPNNRGITFSGHKEVVTLGYAINGYYKGETDLTEVMANVCWKSCTQPQDMVYGMLAVLKYDKFPVDYEISMERLNERVVRYAYYKEDISWLSVGGSVNKGLIQPMCEKFVRVGRNWKGESSIVRFERDRVFVDVCHVADVECCEPYNGTKDDFLHWMIRVFKEWNIFNREICPILMGYHKTESTIRDKMCGLLNKVLENRDKHDTSTEPRPFGFSEATVQADTFLDNAKEQCNTTTILVASNENGRFPLLVSGNANIGDKIMLVPMLDYRGRTLGIVTNGHERNGVCLYKVEKRDRVYKPYEYMI